MIKFVSFLVLFTGFQSVAQNYYFPPASGNWDTLSPNSLQWCQTKIDSLYDYLDGQDSKALIVLKDGKIVLEKYLNGHDATKVLPWFSAGKSLQSVLMGIAQQNGDLSIYDKTSDYLGKGWTSLTPAKEDSIKIWHQLTMTTGLDETNFDCTMDSCLTFKAAPGTRWYYHNSPYTLLKDVLETATGMNRNIYTQQKIKTPIGMSSGIWVQVGYNNFFFSKARDMARFGILVANKGNWNGTSILSDTNYFNQMVNSSQSLNPAYGYLWWLNGKSSIVVPGDSNSYPLPVSANAPNDVFLAAGALGQYISISDSMGLIIIHQGNAQNSGLASLNLHDEIWKRVLDLSCNTTSIAEESFNVSVYPNPAQESLFIKFDGNSKGIHVTLLDMLGNTVLTTIIDTAYPLDVSGLPNGLYTIEISLDGFTSYQKIIISKK